MAATEVLSGLYEAIADPTQFDALLRQHVASQSDCTYVPLNFSLDETAMASDGFHPGAPIYAAWGEAVAEAILSGSTLKFLQN